MTKLSARSISVATAVAVFLLFATACSPLERLRALLPGGVPSQVPQEMATLWEVWQLVEQDFGGKEEIDQRRLSDGAIQGMLAALGDNASTYLASNEYDLDAPELGAVWQAWRAIQPRLKAGNAAVTPQQLQEAAIRGMLDALGNPYTAYLQPEDYARESEDLHSKFEGVGVYVRILDEQLTVWIPIPDSPAERAGILAGDVITQVDGTPTAGISLGEASRKIRGPKGSSVELQVLRPGEERPRVFTVTRDVVKRESVLWQPLGEDLAYLSIAEFLDDTDDDVKAALQEIAAQEKKGLILDIRRNPGGLLSTTVTVASQFLEDGLVLYQVDGHGNRTDMPVQEGGLAKDIPMIVLVDVGSASASEILAGALQDHGRATVIGTGTYGKGSVNELKRLKDGSGLFMASALWYTPSGRLIEGEGLTPDIEAVMDLRIPLGSGLDWQLYTGMQYLLERAPAAAK